MSMKAQILANFLVECTWTGDKLEEVPDEPLAESTHKDPAWILHMDGASNSQGSGVRMILMNLKGVVVEYALHFLFRTTNNQSKYKAL